MDRTFTERASGKDAHRPKLVALLNFVRDGGIVILLMAGTRAYATNGIVGQAPEESATVRPVFHSKDTLMTPKARTDPYSTGPYSMEKLTERDRPLLLEQVKNPDTIRILESLPIDESSPKEPRMHARDIRRYAGSILAACVTLTLLAGCGSSQTNKNGTFFGPLHSIGNGTVKTYVTLDNSSKPTEVGIRMSATSLDGLPKENGMLILALPPQASTTTFNHVMLNWNPHGHPPVVLFGKPHFDVHFYMVDAAAVAKINPSNPDYAAQAAHLPDAKYVPAGYVPPPGPAVKSAVPDMGLHWTDSTDGIVPGKYDFTQILLNGTWNGRYTFIEPMITRKWMLTKRDVRENLKQPQAYQRTGYFPTTYSVRYDDQTKEYSISLGGMMMRHAS